MELPQIDNYQELFVHDKPLLDVRAPVEYSQGAFPNTKNLPLMSDEERHLIGIRYKESGQEQAIALGHELVSGDIKSHRISDWQTFTAENPDGALYCFRGGMRSKISQQWIYENTGVVYPRVKGGYKALRRYLLGELEHAGNNMQFIVLCGRTGVGKTLLINRIENRIDLEGIFKHRGSAFGNRAERQPSQIDVENNLAIELLKQRHYQRNLLVIEDEAMNIGSRCVPESIMKLIRQSPLVMLESSLEMRVENVFNEYIVNDLQEYQSLLGETQGFNTWAENLQKSLARIHKRLGGIRYNNLSIIMQDAIQQQCLNGDMSHHKNWIGTLLTEYYDPMYDYQLGNKQERVVYQGTTDAVLDYIKTQIRIG